MADCFINDSSLSAIADAIRVQTGNDDSWKLYPYQMAGEIRKNLGNEKGFIERAITHLTDNNITIVAPYAFYNYETLSEVSMPSCTQIDNLAFAGCIGLQTINFPMCSTVTAQTFSSCKNIAVATLGVDAIPSNSKSDVHSFVLSAAASSLRTLTLPQCSSIGDRAFLHTTKFKYPNLNKVIAPSCEYIGYNAFSGCTSLEEIEAYNCITISSGAFGGCTNLTVADFPYCTTVLSSAFHKCTNLTYVYFPECTTISTTVFAGCANISTANIGVLGEITSANNPLSEASSTLEILTMSNCELIDTNAFKGYTLLNTVEAQTCSQINTSAFTECANLEYISFPKCSHIGMSAFCGCSRLTDINLSTCQTFGACAFQDCIYIESLTLPACTDIGHSAFLNCAKLSNLTLLAPSVVSLASVDAFTGTPMSSDGSIFVPTVLLDAYKIASNWSNFADRIVPISELNYDE